MGMVTKVCKNCGKEYEACHTAKRSSSVFRWQDVACSPECGTAYFAAVLAARASDKVRSSDIPEMSDEEFEYLYGGEDEEFEEEDEDSEDSDDE